MSAKKERKEIQKNSGKEISYSEELVERICELVGSSPDGLDKLCEENDWMPGRRTINVWRFRYPDFAQKYHEAKKMQAQLLVEQCLEIADTPSEYEEVARSRLRVDTRQWMASKLVPKLYGSEKEDKPKEMDRQILDFFDSAITALNKSREKPF